MLEPLHNLLIEPLISLSAARATLPQVLAVLSGGEQVEFDALQPHQAHAWHSFLVQLGALATVRTPDIVLTDAARWTAALRLLTDGREDPWCLIVPDLAVPAFMQPPVPEGSLKKWKNMATAPDAIDILAAAKNHDVKVERICNPRPEHWIYSLVALQTMQGYSGAGNYGIARMNGGSSNRPSFATSHDLGWAIRFQRDVKLLLEMRGEPANHGFDLKTGRTLLWLEPWDGVEQFGISELDPFFIEVCRRFRLLDENGQITAHWTTSKHARIAAKPQKGNLGDAWTPVRIDDGAALTATNLRYELVQRVLFGEEFQPASASLPQYGDGDEPILRCQVLVRGEGRTDGYHERIIPIPSKARLRLSTVEGRRRLGELSKQRLAQVKEVNLVLKRSLAALLQAEPDALDLRDPRFDPFLASFDIEIDRVFFAQLFDDVELNFEAARSKWLDELFGFARQALDEAVRSAPVPSGREYRARAAAEIVWRRGTGRLRRAAGTT